MIREQVSTVVAETKTVRQAANDYGKASIDNDAEALLVINGSDGGSASFKNMAAMERALVDFTELVEWVKLQPFNIDAIQPGIDKNLRGRAVLAIKNAVKEITGCSCPACSPSK